MKLKNTSEICFSENLNYLFIFISFFIEQVILWYVQCHASPIPPSSLLPSSVGCPSLQPHHPHYNHNHEHHLNVSTNTSTDAHPNTYMWPPTKHKHQGDVSTPTKSTSMKQATTCVLAIPANNQMCQALGGVENWVSGRGHPVWTWITNFWLAEGYWRGEVYLAST